MRVFITATIATALAAAGLGLAAVPSAASAQPAGKQGCVVPKGMNYTICNGRPVKLGNRVATADGGWREESKQGNCIIVRETAPNGEWRETRRCD